MPSKDLRLGLDTGGTYTDAVLLSEGLVIASAKALTTPWNLAIGIRQAIHSVLEMLPTGASSDITLVSVSTTLATNAVVEGRFSPVCTLLIGFDSQMVERCGLTNSGGSVVVLINGGHSATGDEISALDDAGIEKAVKEHGHQVEAFAVAANFSVRNPTHEILARQIIRKLSPKPVTCAHELSSKLDAPRRALTATLNARLTPQIRHLIEALLQVIQQESINAPLMIVKGDGSLMKADIALEYPVETILSGPAASVVGASFLSGLKDFIVSDMGGTTTDIAVVSNGRPAISSEGALVGIWRTMVEAVDARTYGLGGDSEVHFSRQMQLCVGPRKAMPLSLLAQKFPVLLTALSAITELDRLPDHATEFAFRNPERKPEQSLSILERRVLESLGTEPLQVSAVVRNGSGLAALHRLADARLVTLAAFTPSDAMHVLNRQSGWCREAAVYGARILATYERNARARGAAASPENISERTYEHVVRATGRAILEAALAQDPGIERTASWGNLGEKLVEEIVAGRKFSALLHVKFELARPLVAIGAPVSAYYPEVARRLGAPLSIPKHAEVCNAVGAVAGVVSQTINILVNQPTFKVFRVHDPAGLKDYPDFAPALMHAKRVSSELALAAARRAGAADPHVETEVFEKRAQNAADDYLAEATARSVATGRPVVGHTG